MHIARAIIALGLFGWLGWAVLSGQFDSDPGGSSKTRLLKSAVDSVTGEFGVQTTGLVLWGVGLALALLFLALHRRGGHGG